jgi:hypothetical protein
MGKNKPLLGHLVSRFASPENIATESLAFVLAKSPDLRRSFIKFLRSIAPHLPENLVFMTQKHDTDGTVPDMVGSDAGGREFLLL